MSKITRVHKVRSQSDKNIIYNVTVFDDGFLDCDCPQAIYRRGKECKHVRYIAEKHYQNRLKMPEETKFAEGVYFNDKPEKAPDWVIGKVAFQVDKFVAWVSSQEKDEKGYVRIDIKRSKEGKPYCVLNDYFVKKESPEQSDDRHKAAVAGYKATNNAYKELVKQQDELDKAAEEVSGINEDSIPF